MPDYYVPVCLQKKSTSLSNDSASSDGVSFGSSGIVRTLLFFWDCSPSPSSFSSFGYSLTAPFALSHGIWPQVWMPWSPHNCFRKRISKMRLPSSLLLKPRFKKPRSPSHFNICNVFACFLFRFVFSSLLSSRLVAYAPLFPYDPHFHLCLMPMPPSPPPIHFDHLMVWCFSSCLLFSRRSLRKIHIPDQPCFQNVQHLISWFSPDATSNECHALRCLTSLTEHHGNRPKACGLDNDALATRLGMNRGGMPFNSLASLCSRVILDEEGSEGKLVGEKSLATPCDNVGSD